MRSQYKAFAYMVLIVFLISLAYNVNKVGGYCFFDRNTNDRLFGLSVMIPINFFAFKMCKEASFFLEKVICKVFLWIAISGLCDELFFDPYKAGIHEHLAALIVLITIYYYEKSRRRQLPD